jgi:hypothetical protein
MRVPKILFLFFILAANVNLIAQKSSAGAQITDIDFIGNKIKFAYAGFKDKTSPAKFKKLINNLKNYHEKDTFALLSKIILPFNDQHLALYQERKNMEADSVISKKKYTYISKLRPRKKSYEGFWINDLHTIVIYLKLVPPNGYEGYVMESKNKALLGYCIIKMQKEVNGKRVTDYTEVRSQFRMFFMSYFKDKETLITGAYNKWHKVANYKKDMLDNNIAFNNSPAVEKLDSNTVLIKMHDFSSRGVTQKYDSLIKANDKIIAACKNLIIDIRYNAGGSIRNFVSLLPYVCSKPIVRVPYYQLYSNDLIADAEADRKIYLEQNDTAKVKLYNAAIEKMLANKNKLVYNVADTLPCKPVNSNIKNVGLLFNYGSRSAAELMILHFKQIASVTTFGEPSAGAIDYLDILRYKLPETKYTLWVAATKRAPTKEEPLYDKTGISPDVIIGDKTIDWVKFVKKYYE